MLGLPHQGSPAEANTHQPDVRTFYGFSREKHITRNVYCETSVSQFRSGVSRL